MIPDTTHLKAFSNSIPGLQIAWDSTSLGLLKECPRKYLYSILEGYSGQNDHLTFGTHYHKAIEIYDHERAAGGSHDEGMDRAVKYCLEATVIRLPSGGWRPWTSIEPNKNRSTLLRTVVWYLDKFAEDQAETVILANGKPAVELSFRFEIDLKIDNQNALLCGHLDKIVKFTEGLYIMDHKTTKFALDQRFYDSFNPDNQMTLYTIAGQVVYEMPVKGVIIDAAQVLVTLSRFKRGFTYRHKAELDEWMTETKFWIKQAEGFAQHEFFPKNDKSCGNYGGCPYRPICSAAPAMREKLLKATFQRRVWDPLETRGDV